MDVKMMMMILYRQINMQGPTHLHDSDATEKRIVTHLKTKIKSLVLSYPLKLSSEVAWRVAKDKLFQEPVNESFF